MPNHVATRARSLYETDSSPSGLRPSAELAKVLEPSRAPVYGGPGGFDTREGAWSPPAVIAPAMIEEAERLLPALASPPGGTPKRLVAEWLARLGMAVASNMGADEAMGKIEAIAGDLAADYPAGVFTDETRRKAMRAFKWFPSYSELAEILDPEKSKLRRLQRNLEALVRAGRPKAADPVAAVVRSAVKQMPGTKAEKKPEREPILTQPPSAEQLERWARGEA